MDTPAASPEGSTPAAPSTTNLPATPSQVFTDSTPEWVKTAGLQDAHNKGNKAPATTLAPAVIPGQQSVATPSGQTTSAQTPVSPSTPLIPSAPMPLSIDHAALAKAIREGNQPAAPGPTDEEVSRQLGIVSVTPAMYKATFGVDGTPEQIAGLNDYGQGIAKQAVTIASVLMQRELQQLRDQFQPHMEVIQRQERDRIKGEFFKKHADLAGYEAHVTQQYQLLKASGRTFPTIEAASDFVAEQSRSSLNALGITPAALPPANGTSTSARPVPLARTMTPTSVGGKGGGASPATQPTSTIESVWGKQ